LNYRKEYYAALKKQGRKIKSCFRFIAILLGDNKRYGAMSNCRARQCAKEEVLKILFLVPLPFIYQKEI